MHLFTTSVFIFFGLLVLMSLSIIFWTLKNGISPMPSSKKMVDNMQQHLPLHFSGNVLELGSGWGTLLEALARSYPEKQIIGYETSWVPFWFSRLRFKFNPKPHIQIHLKDFLKTSFDGAGLIVCYLYPKAMEKLKNKIENEVRQDLWVVSLVFAIPNWTPYVQYEIDDLYRSKIYLYHIKF